MSNNTGGDAENSSSGQCHGEIAFLCMGVVLATLSFLIIALNATFLLTMALTPRLATLTNKILVCLASLDVLQGMTSIPLHSINSFLAYYNCQQPQWLSRTVQSTGFTLGVMSLFTIFVVALEQYLAIVYPFKYQQQVTAVRTIVPLITIWLASAVITMTCSYAAPHVWHIYELVIATVCALLFIAMFCCYVRVYKEVKATTRRISVTNHSEGKRIQKSARAAKTSFFILFIFIVCYAPFTVYSILITCCINQAATKNPHIEWVYILAMSNALWDSVIYYWRLRSVRNATWQLILHYCWRADTSVNDTSNNNNTKTRKITQSTLTTDINAINEDIVSNRWTKEEEESPS